MHRLGTSILSALLILITAGGAGAQTTFERVRAQMAEVHSRVDVDGTVQYTKQFERWQWFWKARLTPEGDFATPDMYLRAQRDVQRAKMKAMADGYVQALPTWKELGPEAPDLPARNNQWSGIGRVNTVAIHPTQQNTMLLGAAQGGIWRTTNGGGAWDEVDVPEFPIFGVSDIQFAQTKPSVVYVATGDVNASIPGSLNGFPGFSYGVIKSTDNGTTWARTGLTLEPAQNNLVARLWVDPRNEDIVIAATYAGIQKSTDGGTTWTSKTSALPFRDLIGNPKTYDVLYASTFQVFSGGAAIYRSTNAGETWEEVLRLPLANRIRLAVTPANPAMVGAVASEYRRDNQRRYNGLEGVYKSTDYGASFTDMKVTLNLLGWNPTGTDQDGQGFYDLAMAISPTNANLWFVGGVNKWRSTNAGSSWVLSSHWYGGGGAPWVHADHHFMTYHPTQRRLYACTDGGIARSNDDGVTWRDISNGLKIQQYYGLAVSNIMPNVTLAGSQDNGTAGTTDGKTFYHVLDGDGMMTAIDVVNPNTGYASQPNGTFYRTTNGGDNWRQIARPSEFSEPGGAWVAPIVVDPQKEAVVYIGYTQIYRSSNRGTNWQKLSDVQVNSYLRHIAVSPVNSNYIVIANDAQVWLTTNGGIQWTEQPGLAGYVQDVEFHPTEPTTYWVTFGGFSPSNKVVQVSGGKTTNITGAGLPNVPANCVVYQPGTFGRLYVGTDVGVFFRDGDLDVWQPYGAGMPETIISDLRLIPSAGLLRASTYGRGLWEIPAVQCVATKPSVSAVGGITEVCMGTDVVLEAPAGFEAYAWSNGETTRSITLSTFVQSGDYTVSVTDGSGCRATSDAFAVSIKRTPARPSVSVVGGTTLRSSAIGGIQIFQWLLDGTEIPGATQREYVPEKRGQYSVRVTNNDGCSAESLPVEVGDPVSVAEGDNRIAGIRVQPNPVDQVLAITFISGGIDRVEIVALDGRVVTQQPIEPGQSMVEINLERQAPGAYMVRALGPTVQWSEMIVKR
jgi:photosystem II stability/assembly factor-like uncharacterized protein